MVLTIFAWVTDCGPVIEIFCPTKAVVQQREHAGHVDFVDERVGERRIWTAHDIAVRIWTAHMPVALTANAKGRTLTHGNRWSSTSLRSPLNRDGCHARSSSTLTADTRQRSSRVATSRR